MATKKLFVFIVVSTTGYKIRVSIRDPISLDINECELELSSLTLDIFKKQVEYVLGRGEGENDEF